MLVRSILRNKNLAKFNELFVTLNQNHDYDYNTRDATNNLLDTQKILTGPYGENSVRSKASDSWNYLSRTIETLELLNCDFSQFKTESSKLTLTNLTLKISYMKDLSE